jgi:hypothetical protein
MKSQASAAAESADNVITLDQMERMIIAGLEARGREIEARKRAVEAQIGELNDDIHFFASALDTRYGVAIGDTHQLDWAARVIGPKPPDAQQETLDETDKAVHAGTSPAVN